MKYDYWINRRRPAIARPRMSVSDRAVQFSAFTTLMGLDEQLDETARLVSGRMEFSEDEEEMLKCRLEC